MSCETEKNKYCGCLYYSANALARVMSRMAEEEFSITTLAPSYAFLLMIINDKPSIQPKEISTKMMLSPSTVTRLIEKMETRGFVERKVIGKNTEVYPTQKSLELNIKIKQAWVNLFSRYVLLLGEKESQDLTSAIYNATLKLQE